MDILSRSLTVLAISGASLFLAADGLKRIVEAPSPNEEVTERKISLKEVALVENLNAIRYSGLGLGLLGGSTLLLNAYYMGRNGKNKSRYLGQTLQKSAQVANDSNEGILARMSEETSNFYPRPPSSCPWDTQFD